MGAPRWFIERVATRKSNMALTSSWLLIAFENRIKLFCWFGGLRIPWIYLICFECYWKTWSSPYETTQHHQQKIDESPPLYFPFCRHLASYLPLLPSAYVIGILGPLQTEGERPGPLAWSLSWLGWPRLGSHLPMQRRTSISCIPLLGPQNIHKTKFSKYNADCWPSNGVKCFAKIQSDTSSGHHTFSSIAHHELSS